MLLYRFTFIVPFVEASFDFCKTGSLSKKLLKKNCSRLVAYLVGFGRRTIECDEKFSAAQAKASAFKVSKPPYTTAHYHPNGSVAAQLNCYCVLPAPERR